MPDASVRVVNVVDLTVLFPRHGASRTGLSSEEFVRLFTADSDVVFAFHGYARALHQILHGRPSPGRFHVHGFWEQGTTTTPFDMVVLNEMSRYHLADARGASRSRASLPGAGALLDHCQEMLDRHHDYVREHLDDMPEIRDWTWTDQLIRRSASRGVLLESERLAQLREARRKQPQQREREHELRDAAEALVDHRVDAHREHRSPDR